MAFSESEARNLQLDGLRGYGAISVAIFHCMIILDPTQVGRIEWTVYWSIPDLYGRITKFIFALFNGETPVVIFFVLSGTVLFKSLMRSGESIPLASANFLIKRILRIFPALLLCLILCWLVFIHGIKQLTFTDLRDNIALYDFKVNGATWTLNVEMLAIPFILTAFIGYRVFDKTGLILSLVAIFLLFRYVNTSGPPENLRWMWSCFALGVLVPTRIGEATARYLPRHSWAAALVILLGARHFIPDAEASIFVHRAAAALLVAIVYHDRADIFGRFLERPVSVFLGRISYSFYLYAVLTMNIIARPLKAAHPWVTEHPLEIGLAISVPVVLATIPLAMLSYRFVELPSKRLAMRLTRERFPPKIRSRPA